MRTTLKIATHGQSSTDIVKLPWQEIDLQKQEFPKAFESEVLIRFADCDPFNHLNNAKFIEYFMNAREDHLLHGHKVNLARIAREEGLGWLIRQHRLALLNPAHLLETVIIRTSILKWTAKGLLVEMSMWNKDKTRLKALLWTELVHFDLRSQQVKSHSPEMDALFQPYENPLEDQTMDFDERINQLKGLPNAYK